MKLCTSRRDPKVFISYLHTQTDTDGFPVLPHTTSNTSFSLLCLLNLHPNFAVGGHVTRQSSPLESLAEQRDPPPFVSRKQSEEADITQLLLISLKKCGGGGGTTPTPKSNVRHVTVKPTDFSFSKSRRDSAEFKRGAEFNVMGFPRRRLVEAEPGLIPGDENVPPQPPEREALFIRRKKKDS